MYVTILDIKNSSNPGLVLNEGTGSRGSLNFDNKGLLLIGSETNPFV